MCMYVIYEKLIHTVTTLASIANEHLNALSSTKHFDCFAAGCRAEDFLQPSQAMHRPVPLG